MHIDKYRQEDGSYIFADGCHYEDAEDLIQTGILHFCGCGIPRKNLEYVRKVLRHIDRGHDKDTSFNVWEEERRMTFGEDRSPLYFAYYVLCELDLTEHGGSVPGWLTPFGRELLEDLEELLD